MSINLLKHTYNPDRKRLLRPFILQCGTGGTGSILVQKTAKMLASFNIKNNYVLADCDIVEEKNLRNQLFIPHDIGKYKAEILAKRYGIAYSQRISYFTEQYVEDVETLRSLFHIDYERYGDSNSTLLLPILVGCVDNNYTRQVFHQFFEECKGNLLYIDVGNESCTIPSKGRSKADWTKEELKIYNESGWTGQVICGLKLEGEKILSPVADYFPDLLEDEDEIKPSELSCSNIIASDPQRAHTNDMAAIAVSTYLNELFEHGTISNYMTVFHAKKGYMRSKSIE